MEGKACILKDFFFDMNPIVLTKAKIEYNFGLSECNRVKSKTIVLSKDIKIIFFAIFSYFLTSKSRYMYSEKKKVHPPPPPPPPRHKKKVFYLPTLCFFQAVT